MNSKNMIFIVLFAVIIAWSWQKSTLSILDLFSRANAQEEAGQVTAQRATGNVIKDLPCFKCHIYDQFTQEPSPGFFSHALHVQFEYHCNQCHSFSGHRQMVINTSVCTNCHDSVPKVSKQ